MLYEVITSLVISAKIWKTWALVAVYFTTFGGFIALTAWLPVYWVSFYSVSLVTAGTLAGIYSIITSLVRVGGGYLSDRLGGETTGILSLGTIVITSYSIHYTKLYELNHYVGQEKLVPMARITSYNVCYTKLLRSGLEKFPPSGSWS